MRALSADALRRILALHPFSPNNQALIEDEIRARDAGSHGSLRARRLVFVRPEPAHWCSATRRERGLAGGWILIRRGGRSGSRGWHLVHHHLSEEEALQEIERVASLQRRRGYERSAGRPAPLPSPRGQLTLALSGAD